MKKAIGYSLLLVLLLGTMVIPALAQEAFTIEEYNVDIVVREDNSYSVTEEINVFFTEQRRGIFRNIPTFSSNSDARIRGIKVKDHQYTVTSQSNYVEVRIGNPDVYISGSQSYTITYEFIIGDDRIADYDEFYYNLIGTEWDTIVREANFKIEMPKSFDADSLNFTVGYFNAEDNTSVDYHIEGNTIYASTNRELTNYEGVTVALVLPEGYYSDAKPLEAVLNPYRFGYYAIAIIFSVLALFFWVRYGRDNKLVAPIQFYPPNNMTSAEVGYIINDTVDPRDVTSLIIYWASKGYLKIIEDEEDDSTAFSRLANKFSKKEFTLEKVKELQNPKGFENIMFNDLFDVYGDGKYVKSADLKQTFYTTLNVVTSQIRAYFYPTERSIYEKTSLKLRALVVVMAFLSTFAFLSIAFGIELYSAMLGVAIGAIGTAFILLPVLFFVYYLDTNKHMRSAKTIIKAFLMLLVVVPIVFGGLSLAGISLLTFSDVVMIAVSSIFMIFISSIMPKRTPYGDQVLNLILGFRTFLQTAEKDRLERLVDDNPEYFYDTLAFALVLGVSDKWAKKFEDITIEPPNWYVSSAMYRTGFNAMMFNQAFSSSFNTLQTSMASTPPSSRGGGSSFGGGSAGGGAGGGGGGSW
jgi:uncharacterized membrane protein YgcG